MEFFLSKEDQAFRQEVREFLAKEVPPDWAQRGPSSRRHGTSGKGHRQLRRHLAGKAAEKGWLSMIWPEEYGGSNASHIKSLIFEEEVSYVGAPIRDMLGLSLCGTLLMKFGTKEQRQKHLPPMARGEVFWAEGLSEPGAGSDLAGVQTKALEITDGWIVNGQKIWTSGAHNADWIFMLVRTDPAAEKHRGLSVMLADLQTQGITLRPILDMNGYYLWNEVFFDDVKLPKDALVGEQNMAWPMIGAVLNVERASLSMILESVRRCTEFTVRHIKESKPYALQDSAIRQRLSRQVAELNTIRVIQYRIAWMEDHGMDSTLEASMYKILTTECYRRATDFAMEVLGPYSQLMEDSWQAQLLGWVPSMYLDSFGWTLGGGTSEIQRNIIARRGLGLPSERTRVTR